METKSDIIAELRSVAFSMKVHDAMMPEVYDILCGVAFRLEAAWKREKADAESDALAVGGIVEAARTTEKSSAVGNAAAMREALIEIVDRAIEVIDDDEGTYRKIVELAQAALAEPARNCDVHTGWLTALKKFNDTDGKRKPWGDDVFDTRFLDWLFAFVTEKGANDGR